MTHTFSFYDQMVRQQRDALFLYVDIETIPSQDPAVLDAIRAKHVIAPVDLDAVRPDARLTDPAKIAADVQKKRIKAAEDYFAAVDKSNADTDAEYRRTALDASTGHIVCASFSLDDAVHSVANEACDPYHEIRNPLPAFNQGTYVDCDHTHREVIDGEREMLIELFFRLEGILEAHANDAAIASLEAAGRDAEGDISLEIQHHRHVPVVVAHHANFDVRYLWQRAIILGVTPPAWWPIDARPWDTDRVYDTMTAWAGHGNRIGLDRLCRALGLPGKTGVDGSMVWDLVRDGRIDDVVDYCDDDVRRLRSVHRKMIGLPLLEIDAIEVPAAGENEREAA